MSDQVPRTPARRGVEAGRWFVEEDKLGRADDPERHVQAALLAAGQGPDSRTRLVGESDQPEHLCRSEYEVEWMPGRREMASASLVLKRKDGTELPRITFEKLYTFRMRGIGYMHPHWSHGSNHGELEVGGESIKLDEFDPADPSTLHIQTLCRVRIGAKVGIGVLEQIALGPHEPTGLTGVLDGYSPS